jgi:hypothetical protein
VKIQLLDSGRFVAPNAVNGAPLTHGWRKLSVLINPGRARLAPEHSKIGEFELLATGAVS